MSANTFLPPSPVNPPSILISNITRTYPMVITVAATTTLGVSTTDLYVIGQLVFLTVPASYGMIQANNLTGQITAVIGQDFSVDIDARGFDAFVTPATYQPQPASLGPAGSRNIYNSLSEPFHSNGNTGN